MSNRLIFGYTWKQIQKAQQRQDFKEYVSGEPNKPQANESDVKLLVEKGLSWLEEQQFFGVLDRLKNSGIIE